MAYYGSRQHYFELASKHHMSSLSTCQGSKLERGFGNLRTANWRTGNMRTNMRTRPLIGRDGLTSHACHVRFAKYRTWFAVQSSINQFNSRLAFTSGAVSLGASGAAAPSEISAPPPLPFPKKVQDKAVTNFAKIFRKLALH